MKSIIAWIYETGTKTQKGFSMRIPVRNALFLCKAAVLDLPEERLPNGQEGEQNGYEDWCYRRW